MWISSLPSSNSIGMKRAMSASPVGRSVKPTSMALTMPNSILGSLIQTKVIAYRLKKTIYRSNGSVLKMADIPIGSAVHRETCVSKFGADLDVVLCSDLDNPWIHLSIRATCVRFVANHFG